MGMDLSGFNPKSEKGDYFRNNCWWWRPLWDFVCDNVDVITEDDASGGHYNDGHLIDEKKCDVIVERLTELLENGYVKTYQDTRQKQLDKLPMEKCEICDGSGVRNDKIIQGECNGCSGTGKKEPWAKSYPFEVENVEEFVEFVKDSGGFQIF